jgi:hypothetical protein
MTFTIPDVYIAFCGGASLGALLIIGLAYILASTQRNKSGRPK